MAILTLIGRKKAGDNNWRYGMDYNEACRKYKQEHEDLGILRKRLISAKGPEIDRVQGNIASKRSSISLLKKWFKFHNKKLPEIA